MITLQIKEIPKRHGPPVWTVKSSTSNKSLTLNLKYSLHPHMDDHLDYFCCPKFFVHFEKYKAQNH